MPNAWDVGSAYVFEKAGFKALATTSAGIAYDLGLADGEGISFTDLLWVVEKMAKRVDVPLSVDFERGYGKTCEEIKENARKLLYAGAVGFNIEDGLADKTLCPLDMQREKIKALVTLKQELDIDFVINARTCVYLLNMENEEDKFNIACERGNAFAAAGADCVFIPGAMDEATISNLVKEINAPINILLNNKCSNFETLEKIGVRRASTGSAPVRYVYKKTIEMTGKLYTKNITELGENDFSYEKANTYFGGLL